MHNEAEGIVDICGVWGIDRGSGLVSEEGLYEVGRSVVGIIVAALISLSGKMMPQAGGSGSWRGAAVINTVR